jgi:hypothetical protein
LVLLANVIQHFNVPANRRLLACVAGLPRSGGILVVLDDARQLGQRVSPNRNADGSALRRGQGGQLWTLTGIQSWQQQAAMQSLSPVT